MRGYTYSEAAARLRPHHPNYYSSLSHLIRRKHFRPQDFKYLESLHPRRSEDLIEAVSERGVTIQEVYLRFGITPSEVDAAR